MHACSFLPNYMYRWVTLAQVNFSHAFPQFSPYFIRFFAFAIENVPLKTKNTISTATKNRLACTKPKAVSYIFHLTGQVYNVLQFSYLFHLITGQVYCSFPTNYWLEPQYSRTFQDIIKSLFYSGLLLSTLTNPDKLVVCRSKNRYHLSTLLTSLCNDLPVCSNVL